MNEPEHLLTLVEVAARLGLSPITVGHKLRAGELPGFKYGRLWRCREIDLDEYVRRVAEEGAKAAAKRKAKRGTP